MRTARRQGVLRVIRCGTGSSSRVRARAPFVQPLFRGSYKRGHIHVLRWTKTDTMDALMHPLVHLRNKTGGKGGGGGGGGTSGEPVQETSFWDMLYADDAGVVSQSPEQLRKMMGLIVVVCAAFGLTVSDIKTHVVASGNTPWNCTTDQTFPSSSKSGC